MLNNDKGLSAHIDAALLQWLNHKAGEAGGEEWLLNSMQFFLKKIARHEQIRLDRDGHVHRRFWRDVEHVFQMKLMQKHTRSGEVNLYLFIENVAEKEVWIVKEKNQVRLTDRGKSFLQKQRRQQLNQILEHLWPTF